MEVALGWEANPIPLVDPQQTSHPCITRKSPM